MAFVLGARDSGFWQINWGVPGRPSLYTTMRNQHSILHCACATNFFLKQVAIVRVTSRATQYNLPAARVYIGVQNS